jgi:YesN/AraC family two-component response regulator
VGARTGTEFIVALPMQQGNGFEKLQPVATTQMAETTLPIQQQATKSEHPAVQPTVQETKLKESTKPVILLAEDNADVVTYIVTCLEELEEIDSAMKGYQLVVGKNGREGLDMAIELIPDLVISDVMMPVMDGFEFCRHLKTDARTSHIPVIILTAKADLDSKIEGLEYGANAYLSKPFEPQELLLTIQNLFKLRNNLRKKFQEQIGSISMKEVDPQIENTSDSLNIEDQFVQKVVTIIESHLSKLNLDVGQIAKEVHLSHSQLARKLDAVTGYSPNRFIRLIRLTKAKELLADENLSITTIAYDCGFSDPSYFSRVFKKEFGKTPVTWREQFLSSQEVLNRISCSLSRKSCDNEHTS